MSGSGPIASDATAQALAIRERLLSGSAWVVAVWVGTALYAVLLSAESIVDHHDFRTGFDTAIYDQLLWLIAHGHEPFSTVVNRPMLADHFQPSLFLLTPLYWLGLNVPGILAVQSIGLALTAPALFALARSSGASPALASIPAFLWLVCPWVASVNLFEFRPTAFAPVLLVLSVLAARERRDILLAVTMILALSLKEDVSLTYVVLGILIAYQGRRRVGGIVAVTAAIWFVFASWVVETLGGSYDAFGQRFAGVRGESVGDALLWSIQHPVETFSHVGSESVLPLALVFLSTGGLALLAPYWLMLSAPTVIYNALSYYAPQQDLDNHYHLGTLIGLFAALAIGVVRLPSLDRRARLAVAAGVTLAVGVVVIGGIRAHAPPDGTVTLDRKSAQRALDVIPPDAAVAAVLPMLPQLSQRAEIYTLPEPFISLDWGSPLSPAELAERAARVRYVAYIEGQQARTFYTGEIGKRRAVPDVRPMLAREGFVVIARAGPLEILERR